MKVILFIGRLGTGGAERQLCVLAKGLATRGHRVTVITIFPGGQIADDLQQVAGVKLLSLWYYQSRNILGRVWQLSTAPLLLNKLVKDSDCLYSMLEITNFIAWLATRFRSKPSLAWGIRSSHMEGHWKMATFDKLCALVSPTVKLLIANSHAGLECLLKRGYHPQKYLVIHNGIDIDRFQFNEKLRKKIRSEVGISSDQLLVGSVSRLTLKKDHQTFLKAVALVAKEIENIRFLCVGDGPDDYVEVLQTLSKKLGLEKQVVWLGERKDMPAIYSSLDLLVSSSSYGEGFPNVIGEAMACGVPCVVTDVGDSSEIVGCDDYVVSPNNPEILACSIILALKKKYDHDSPMLWRERVEEKFSVRAMVDLTEKKLEEISEQNALERSTSR